MMRLRFPGIVDMTGMGRTILACCVFLLVLVSVDGGLFANDERTRAARLDEANSLMARGNIAISQSDFVTTELLWLEALDIYEEQRSLYGQMAAFDRLGKVALAQQAYERAEDYQIQALEKTIELKAPSEQMGALGNLAYIAMEQGLYSKAEDYYRQSIALSESTQVSDYMHVLLQGRADLAGDDTPAAFSPELPEEILRQNIEQLIQDQSSHTYAYLSLVRHAQADIDEAEKYLMEYSERRAALGDRGNIALLIFQLSQFAQRLGLDRASCWYAHIGGALRDDDDPSEVNSVIHAAAIASTCSKVGEQL